MPKIASAAMVASAVEWFDFFIYITASSLIFGPLFFPDLSGVGGALASFATLAVGFLARPLGGVVSGHLGDRWGRKPTLVLTVVAMGTSTALIGVLPTYATAGVLAPILLVVLRILQGLAVGGQWGGAALLCTEHAPAGKRGFYGSFPQMGATLGAILGNSAFLALVAVMSQEAFRSWGWRIPFLSGLVLVALGFWIQRAIEDTPVFQQLQQQSERAQAPAKTPVVEALRHHWRPILLAAGSFVVVNATYYIFISGVLDYTTRVLDLSRETMLAVVLAALCVHVAVIPIFGAASDRFGRRPLFISGAVAMAIWAFPLFFLLDTRSPEWIAVALVVGLIIHGAMYGPQTALFSEMFSARIRYSGASLGYQLGSVVAGGFAPFIMTGLLAATGASWSIALYMIVLAAVTLGCVLAISESKDRDLNE